MVTEIVGAVIILALVERKLRHHDVEHLKKSVNNFQSQLYFFAFPNAKRLAEYLEQSSSGFNKLSTSLYIDRTKIENRLKIEKDSFALIGGPGTGKTTLLQRLYIDICERTIVALSSGNVPVFIHAKWITPDVEFVEDMLRLHFEQYSTVTINQLYKYIKSGRLVLIVDGLDELAPDQLRDVIGILSSFHDQWPNNQIIVSSRDPSTGPSQLGLKTICVPELTHDEQKRFADLYRIYSQGKINKMKCCSNCQEYKNCKKRNSCCDECAFYENGRCACKDIEREGEDFGFFSELLEMIFRK
ncbi:MAG: hypothetical protein A7316_08545 [Candidatus Altiarchaeales archaeon WOR_SM1_86-2]|nr:MAG: hypothetical protein A7316_08545 [Candidatus Altiarchaeales archaeon WOR_SM1_86-2]